MPSSTQPLKTVLVVLALCACGPSRGPQQAAPSVDRANGGSGQLPLATPCSISAGLVTVSLSPNETATLTLDGSNRLVVNGLVCATATTGTMTRIFISAADQAASTDETVVLDESNGLFAPGTSTSAGVVISLGNGTADAVQLIGGSGDDVFLAGHSTGDEWATINHDVWKDVSMTGVENFTMSGANGNDTLNGSGSNPAWTPGTYFTTGHPSQLTLSLSGGQGADLLTGGDGNDNLLGGDGDDFLYGSAGDDTENGENGNDTLDQGAGANGADVLVGGANVDTVTYTARTGPVHVSIGSAANDGEAGESDDVRSDVEVVVGGTGDDTLSCELNTGCALWGGTGHDTLTGKNGADTLNGEAGNDVLQPGPGDDVVNGGPGIDTVTYADATHPVSVTLGSLGTPTTGNGATSVGESDSIDAVENIIGGDFGDTLNGNAADNRLTGGLGNDALSGGAGNDTFDEGPTTNGADLIVGGPGEDRVDYSARTVRLVVTMDGSNDDGEVNEHDNIATDVENLSGGAGADDLTGNALDNKLDGNDGNDTLSGLGGNDELTGGRGLDVLSGGDDDDILDQGPDGATCACGDGFDIAICDTAPVDCEVR